MLGLAHIASADKFDVNRFFISSSCSIDYAVKGLSKRAIPYNCFEYDFHYYESTPIIALEV